MAKVTYSAGIDHMSGALSKPSKSGQHSCEKMLLATHRTAATTSNKCNRLYLRTPVKRTSPLSQREFGVLLEDLRRGVRRVALVVAFGKEIAESIPLC